MFKFNKVEKTEEDDKLREFKEEEIEKLKRKYYLTQDNHIKSKNDLILAILMLNGDIEEVRDINVLCELQDIKHKVDRIYKMMGELLSR